MANPNFDPQASSNTLWYGDEEEVCLTDVIDEALADIADLENNKAPNDHTHDGYAPSNHTHNGYAASDHAHTAEDVGAAAANHTHNYAAPTHTHAQSEISGLIAALAAKANETHDHTLAQIVGLVAVLAAKADLVDGKVPADQLPSFVDDVVEYAAVSNFPATGESGKIYVATGTNKSYRWSGTTYVEIAGGVALGETSATAYRGDRGKTAYEHSQNAGVHVTTAQKTAWDGKAAGDHTHTLAALGAAAESHSHDYIAKALQFTTDIGGMEKTIYTADNKNLIAEFEALSMGFHTVYAQAGVEGAPNTTESWRCLLHKPSSNIMWVLAFGTTGAIRSNYWNGGTWHGWRKVYTSGDAPTPTSIGAASAVAYGGDGASTYKKVWIATTGSDDNAGTSGSPMATITGAIRKYSEKYKMLDISLADGTYNENLGAVSPALINLAIRSNSENKDAVVINMEKTLEVNVPILRMYNISLNMPTAGVRPISVTGGKLYMNNVRVTVPTNSGSSCVNVYNGCDAVLMGCVLNSGTSGSGAGAYGNQAGLIKVINCTSERTVAIGVYATNGSDIEYTDTITATTKAKTATWGKCTLR